MKLVGTLYCGLSSQGCRCYYFFWPDWRMLSSRKLLMKYWSAPGHQARVIEKNSAAVSEWPVVNIKFEWTAFLIPLSSAFNFNIMKTERSVILYFRFSIPNIWCIMSWEPVTRICRTREVFSWSDLDRTRCYWQLRRQTYSDVKLPFTSEVQCGKSRDHIHCYRPIRE